MSSLVSSYKKMKTYRYTMYVYVYIQYMYMYMYIQFPVVTHNLQTHLGSFYMYMYM